MSVGTTFLVFSKVNWKKCEKDKKEHGRQKPGQWAAEEKRLEEECMPKILL